MKNIKEYLITEARANEFIKTLQNMGIIIYGPDSVGITYIGSNESKFYNIEETGIGGVAPSFCLEIDNAAKTFISYDENVEDGVITMVTKYTKSGESTKQFKVKNVLELTQDGKAYKLNKHNAEVLANILINKKVVK